MCQRKMEAKADYERRVERENTSGTGKGMEKCWEGTKDGFSNRKKKAKRK